MIVQMTEDERAELIEHIGAITGTASGILLIAAMNQDEGLKNLAEIIEQHGWQILKLICPEEHEKCMAYIARKG